MQRLLPRLLALVALGCPASLLAAEPVTLDLQGLLRAAGGGAVPDGAYDLTLGLYDGATGGVPLYAEKLAAIEVKAGFFAARAGKLDLGAETGDEITAAQAKTLTGGGNADALHKHAAGPVSGGCGLLVFKGVTDTPRLGNVGLGVLNDDCHAKFPGARICRDEDLLNTLPWPKAAKTATVLVARIDGIAGSFGFSSGSHPNCTLNGMVFGTGGQYSGHVVLDSSGDLKLIWCSEPTVTACCGS
jgi:hypothetical protein